MNIFKLVFGSKKVMADIDSDPPSNPSKSELALGREGAGTLIRELKEAKAAEDAGEYAKRQIEAIPSKRTKETDGQLLKQRKGE
jgi:hypothetical protein